MNFFRKRINLRPEEALFFFVNGSIPSTSNTMGEVKFFALQKSSLTILLYKKLSVNILLYKLKRNNFALKKFSVTTLLYKNLA